MEYYSAARKDEVMQCAVWMDLDPALVRGRGTDRVVSHA